MFIRFEAGKLWLNLSLFIRSIPTLTALIILVSILDAFQGVLDFIRQRLLVRVARGLDERLSKYAYRPVVQLPLTTGSAKDG